MEEQSLLTTCSHAVIEPFVYLTVYYLIIQRTFQNWKQKDKPFKITTTVNIFFSDEFQVFDDGDGDLCKGTF